jgi:hypothetical protein
MNRMPATRKSAFICKFLPLHAQRFENEPQREDGSDAVEQIARIDLRAVGSVLAAEHVREYGDNSSQRDQPGNACRNPPHRAVPPYALSVTRSIVPQRANDETVLRVGSRAGQAARVLPGQVTRERGPAVRKKQLGPVCIKAAGPRGSRCARPHGSAAVGGPIALLRRIVRSASRPQMKNS